MVGRGFARPQFGQSLFLGIPYAQPPVRDLRLRPPRSINASFGTPPAVAYGPHCWSAFTTGFDDNSGFESAEDYLTLNVVRPDGVAGGAPVPVAVWIRGGGLTTGENADFRYNGTYLVRAFVANGNPILPAGGARVPWRYGAPRYGNTSRDSGAIRGATSAHAHIIAYGGRDDGLFNQAIVQNGTSGGKLSLPDAAAFQATFDGLIANTACAATANSSATAQLDCVRALPIDVFRRNAVRCTNILFDANIIAVPGILEAYRTGRWVKVAFIIGSNTDEGCSFAHLGANTTAQAKGLLTDAPAAQQDAVLALYPDFPALGCLIETGEFQLDPNQNGFPVPPRTQNKRIFEGFVGHFSEVACVFNTQNNGCI
ncbi:Alpha/Beta hydrolase protein [Mycena vulgaris]|nr:Alpha/Beta hydrolase protein [Mycena vulgaris]